VGLWLPRNTCGCQGTRAVAKEHVWLPRNTCGRRDNSWDAIIIIIRRTADCIYMPRREYSSGEVDSDANTKKHQTCQYSG
jgi:hypothetical protein